MGLSCPPRVSLDTKLITVFKKRKHLGLEMVTWDHKKMCRKWSNSDNQLSPTRIYFMFDRFKSRYQYAVKLSLSLSLSLKHFKILKWNKNESLSLSLKHLKILKWNKNEFFLAIRMIPHKYHALNVVAPLNLSMLAY